MTVCQCKPMPLIHRYRSIEWAVVASRLALRWAAKRPQIQTLSSFRKIAVPLLGLLRNPTQGKPARHWEKWAAFKICVDIQGNRRQASAHSRAASGQSRAPITAMLEVAGFF